MPKHRRPHQGGAAGGTSMDVKLSKTMSWLLRHGAKDAGFELQPGGFLYVDEVLSLQQLRGFSEDDVRRVVETNEKQRFALEPHPDTGRLRIRANQGHSLQVESLNLTPILDATEFPEVVHGTYARVWPIIQKQGLSRMNRTHIHFAPGEPGESGVISGMRGSCDILIFIDLQKALKDGFKFFVSANHVILCPGNEAGVLPPQYFRAACQRHPRKKLPLT